MNILSSLINIPTSQSNSSNNLSIRNKKLANMINNNVNILTLSQNNKLLNSNQDRVKEEPFVGKELYDDIIKKTFFRIKELFSKSDQETKGKGTDIKFLFEDDSLDSLKKLESISVFISLSVDEKLKFYNQSKQEVKNIDDILNELRKTHNFDQVNFKKLIDKVKIAIQTEKQDTCYIEKLKQDIMTFEREKKDLIDISKKTIESLKSDCLEFIRKIETIDNEKSQVEKNYHDLINKIEVVEKKEIENRQLKKEIEYLKMEFIKEKTRISMLKEKEMKEVESKLKFMIKLEKDNYKKETDLIKMKVKLVEEEKEKSKLFTVRQYFIINIPLLHKKLI